jgi:DNA-binding NtrC family response regulator
MNSPDAVTPIFPFPDRRPTNGHAEAAPLTRVLLIDEDKVFRQSLADSLRRADCDVRECASSEGALGRLKEAPFDAVVLDPCVPGDVRADLLRETRTRCPQSVVIILTSQGSIDDAVAALRSGAQDYVVKPVPPDALGRRLDELLRAREAAGGARSPAAPAPLPAPATFAGLVGASPAMSDLHKVILKVARADSTVLVTGETGTGKELIARAIHENGPRRDRPFVALNCSAIPEALLESQLFGHVRGAFTGADRDRRGFFDTAADGTIFLDEIGEMPLALQPKILRALDAREFLPLGSTVPLRADARVVVATNRDLKAMVGSGHFRQDLYYRLSTFEIPVPPLRARAEDIEGIARYLMGGIARSMNRVAPALSPQALSTLESHAWPGNVRELANVLERAMILQEGPTIEACDLPGLPPAMVLPPQAPLRAARKAFERLYSSRVVEACGGDKVRAAKLLGVGLASLYRKLSDPRPGPSGTD